MKTAKKVPYEAPRLGDLELLLNRTILAGSELVTPDADTNEGVTWVTDY